MNDSEGQGDVRSDPLVIVGVGASAGGLNALKKLFTGLRPTANAAFVVVVHLSPDHESHLADLLQPYCELPIEQVTETVRLEADRVYVIPPNANLNAIDTHLRLSELEGRRRERAPIDHFFRTLAETHDGHSIGVVLTGTGSDGTLGLQWIKERGGLAVVQDPEDAEFDGMPRSAIAAGVPDLILTLADMPEQLLGIIASHPHFAAEVDGAADLADQERFLQKIFAQVRARTGHDFTLYKRSTLLRRIGRRMQLHKIDELSDYLEFLRDKPEETLPLANDLLITVTEFFRDREVFERLAAETIPGLFNNKTAGDRIRVWSVGCSTGEEAYSLAILLLEEAGKREVRPQIQIFASDLHEKSVARAREGVYPETIRGEVTEERLSRWFVKENGNYRVRKEVRELVVFAPHDLLKDPPFSHLDLIVCRNVMIYLQRDAQHDVISLFHYALKEEGRLLLGTAETIDASGLFSLAQKGVSLFHRVPASPRETRLRSFPLATHRDWDAKAIADAPTLGRGVGATHAEMVERYAPPSLLLGRDHNVVHVSAHAGRYFRVPSGEVTDNAFKLLQEPLSIELRAAMHLVGETGKCARTRAVTVSMDGGQRQVALHVRPATGAELAGFTLVLFDEIEEIAVVDAGTDASSTGLSTREIEAELDLSKRRLRTVVEEFEISQEAMQAANEELQSANEELRSTLEELETSKEELQSMNEELATLNQENRHRVDELGQLSSDLQNLLAATEIATLFLDRDLRIVRFTPLVGELFNVRHTDRGRPLADLTHRLGYDDLQSDSRRALDRLGVVEREVAGENDRWYLSRILPYRTTDDRIDGVVITLQDITDRRNAQQAVRESEDRLRTLNDELERRVADRTVELRDRESRLGAMTIELSRAERNERLRLAHVLHDDAQQSLVAAQMRLGLIEVEGLNDEGRDDVETAMRLLEECQQTLRSLASELAPPSLHQQGLASTLEWLAQRIAAQHLIKVDVVADADADPMVESTRDLMFQIVRELLLNVVKHAETDRAAIRLVREGNEIRLDVRDEGRGFDPATVEQSTERTFGLFHARDRLANLDGSLDVVSAPGKGTTATIRVPVTSLTDVDGRMPTRHAFMHPDAASESDDRTRVVLADDHRTVREGLSRLLEREPRLRVVGQAGNGLEALSVVRNLRPHVVVMDMDMPEMNGVDATRLIKSEFPDIRVIGLSLHEEAEMAKAMLDAGAERYLPKRASSAELVDAVLGRSEQ